VPYDRNGLETIDEPGCRALLATAAIGRLALSYRALPIVLPVNFAVCGDAILIRTGAGAKFEAACHQSVVAFEVDGFDSLNHTGWSVLVQGRARVLHGPAELDDARQVGLTPWANPNADAYVTIGMDLVTGRRLGAWYRSPALPVHPRVH